MLSASPNDDKIAWYENLGGGDFSAQRIIMTDADRPSSVHAADLDGDGDADVLSAFWDGDKIAWQENLGGGQFSGQRVITTDADGAQFGARGGSWTATVTPTCSPRRSTTIRSRGTRTWAAASFQHSASLRLTPTCASVGVCGGPGR